MLGVLTDVHFPMPAAFAFLVPTGQPEISRPRSGWWLAKKSFRKGWWKTSPQIFFVVFHPVPLEKRRIFLLKPFRPMMLGLVRNVFLDRVAIGNAHGERTITRLPREIFHADGFMNPARRSLFDVLHKRRERMGRSQTRQQMNVVRRAADGFGNPVRRAHQAAKMLMQTSAPFIRDEGMPVFRAEDDVKMQA